MRATVGVTGVALALGGAGAAIALGGDGAGGRAGGSRTVELGIVHSRFSESVVQVEVGTEVRFVLDNEDPILHELIVGPPEVHERHENGTEAAHPPRPGEVTVEPLSVAETTYRFDETGTFEFACHLPGHRAYGMTGDVVVVAAD